MKKKFRHQEPISESGFEGDDVCERRVVGRINDEDEDKCTINRGDTPFGYAWDIHNCKSKTLVSGKTYYIHPVRKTGTTSVYYILTEGIRIADLNPNPLSV